MGASNSPDLRFPKGKGRAAKVHEAEREAEARRVAVYHEVDVRDGFHCRCCGRRGSPYATTLLDKLHHDHIVELSLGGGDVTSNLCLLCARCHERKTGHEIEPQGDPDAGTLVFAMRRSLATEIFRGRRIPAHIRFQETA